MFGEFLGKITESQDFQKTEGGCFWKVKKKEEI